MINKCPNVFKTLFLTGAILFATLVTAQTPSPAQIAQFKSMPPAQQKALAQSMGIDINDFSGILGGNDAAPTFTSEVVSQNRSPAKTIIADPKDDLEVAGVNEKEDIQKLKFFGYDIFQFGADSFTPASDIPIPSNYIVGPGDTLIVQLYGKESATHTLSINRDGSVQFPEIGPISLAGLSFSDTEKKISEVVSEQMIGIKSSITMGALRTIRIFVLGEVNVPGSYVVGSLSTMTNAIFASGGITKLGSLRNVQLKRAGKTITSLDLYALLLKGDTSQDSRLLPGDVIFIPPLGRTAGISGAVKRPAMYELRNEATVEDLLKMSGGLTPHAYLDATKIERIFKTGEKSLVSLNLTNRNAYNTPIHDADILHIGSTLDLFLDTITVQGHVKRPDDLAWRAGLKFTDLISSSDQLLDLPDLDIAIIERKVPITGEIEVYSFSPGEALMNPKGPSDPHISSRDRVTIFDYTTDRAEQLQSLLDRLAIQADIDQHEKSLNIQGSIRFPGVYPLTEGMKLSQLVSLSGGYSESALGREAEITRYSLNENRERVVMHIDVLIEVEDPLLKAGDILHIKQIPLWQKKESVVLTGEFIHPGTYSILPGESLMDVIRRAGGLSSQAFPEGAIFSRETLRELEAERLLKLRKDIESELASSQLNAGEANAEIDMSDAQLILDNIDGTQALGRMVIDLKSILQSPDDYDFQLTAGDTINVPRFKPSVTVVGEVQYGTSHFYDNRLNVKDYLERSGGLKRKADKKRIYVIKANGMVYQPKRKGWFRSNNMEVNPGDTIVVPLDTNNTDRLSVWASVAQILANTGLGIAALASF